MILAWVAHFQDNDLGTGFTRGEKPISVFSNPVMVRCRGRRARLGQVAQFGWLMVPNVFTLTGVHRVTRLAAVNAFLRTRAPVIVWSFVFLLGRARHAMVNVMVFTTTNRALKGMGREFALCDSMVDAPATAALPR